MRSNEVPSQIQRLLMMAPKREADLLDSGVKETNLYEASRLSQLCLGTWIILLQILASGD